MRDVIPVMHCFDSNYVIPAGVAFYSMLANASRKYTYKLYVLHTDITDDDQARLHKTISCFDSASLEFINMGNKFEDLFRETASKGHYSKEMFYKFLAPSIFKQYEKVMIADVDVVYLGDISENFVAFDVRDDYYFAGAKGCVLKGSWVEQSIERYSEAFSGEEIAKLVTGAGYYIFNVSKMRSDRCEEKFIAHAAKNSHRLLQPEQDVINLICYPKIKILPVNTVVCSYVFDLYKSESDFNSDREYSAAEVGFAMNNPIQLHYAGGIKPWNNLSSTKSEVWFEYLARTPFLKEYLKRVDEKLEKSRNAKVLFSFDVPFGKRKIVVSKSKI